MPGDVYVLDIHQVASYGWPGCQGMSTSLDIHQATSCGRGAGDVLDAGQDARRCLRPRHPPGDVLRPWGAGDVLDAGQDARRCLRPRHPPGDVLRPWGAGDVLDAGQAMSTSLDAHQATSCGRGAGDASQGLISLPQIRNYSVFSWDIHMRKLTFYAVLCRRTRINAYGFGDLRSCVGVVFCLLYATIESLGAEWNVKRFGILMS
jgi:hypothetical protein